MGIQIVQYKFGKTVVQYIASAYFKLKKLFVIEKAFLYHLSCDKTINMQVILGLLFSNRH